MGRKEGPSEERRAAILGAAEQVFAEHGYHGASIREITRRAGVSSALLYWFFPDKAALLIEVLKGRVLENDEPVFFPPRFLDSPPEVVIPFIAQRYLDVMSNPDQVRLLRMFLSEGQREPELVGRLAGNLLNRVLEPFSQYVARQARLGRMREVQPELAAQALFGTMISFVLRRDILQEQTLARFSNEQIAVAVTDIFLHGVGGSGKGPDLDALKPAQQSEKRAAQRIELEE